MMSSEGELASILSHELAHIQARHIQRQMEKSRILSIASLAGMLAGILLGSVAGGTGAQVLALGSIAGAKSVALKYSREHEEEADQIGFRYLCSSGYEPMEMSGAMQKLNQGTFYVSSTVPSYLSTHPNLTERVHGLQHLAKTYKSNPGNRIERSRTEKDFLFMQAALMAEYSEQPELGERLEAKAATGDVPSLYGLGRLHLKQGKTAEAVIALQQAARQSSGSTFVLSTLGAAYVQQGKLEDARKVLQSALLLDSTASIVHLRLARVFMEMGQRDEALSHLQQIESLAESFPEIDHQLGVLLGQTNRLADAHYHLGRYFVNRMDWKLALFHFQKAKALPGLSASRMTEMDSMLKTLEKRDKKKSDVTGSPRRR
jgi:predicted Zn-dependent protease